MVKLLKTSNEAQRHRGVEIAIRLGKSALPDLHNLFGHTRRDIRNSAAAALGQILDLSSIPFLVAGLYGNATRPGQFRPSVHLAAQALAEFAPEQRLQALHSVKYPIRPNQIQTILNGIQSGEGYELAQQLRRKGLILTDWAETDFQVFLAINEERVWPEVMALVGNREDFKLQQIYPHLNNAKRLALLSGMVNAGADTYHYGWMVDAVLAINCDSETKHSLIKVLREKIARHSGKFDERERLVQKLDSNR